MGLNVDQQFFDLFTAIDNLMKQNNQLQQQNNALLQQNNSLLGAILEKPAILEAPRLTELAITQQAISVPENIDLAPQFFIDSDARVYYTLVRSFFTSAWHDLGPRVTTDSGDFKLSDIIPFDLIRILNFKNVGFGMSDPVTGAPENVRATFIKNFSGVYSFFVLPDTTDRQFPDRSDTNYTFKPEDTVRDIVTNESYSLSIRLYVEKQWGIYKEIPEEALQSYVDLIKKIVSS